MSSSFAWFKKYSALQGSVFNTEKSSQIAEMEANFSSEKKDQQISLLQAENELEHNKKENQFLLSVVIVATLIILLLALFYVIRQKQKSNGILRAQKEYLDELNHLKDKLFSVISHDLRSPLNSLQGLMYLIENNMVSEAELKANLAELSKSTRSMSDLIDYLLHWAKSNLHREIIEKQRIEVDHLIEKNIRLFHQQALGKRIAVTRLGQVKEAVSGDANMIDLVLRNLLSNAIKFTQENGRVSISVERENGEITISVKDTGVAFSPERFQRLFSPQNNSTTGTNNEKGTGLGLLLCKDFVEKNGGRIWAESNPGEGTTFSFTLTSAD
jgi:signal transduction histidine kinase